MHAQSSLSFAATQGKFLPTKYLPAITGYLEKTPDSSIDCFAEISVFRKSDICKFDRIVVGGTRLTNHSCRPNCKNNIANVGRRKVIKLEMLLPINCGHEITVFYSPENFIGNGNVDCLCPHNDMHAQDSLSFAATQEQETFPVGNSTSKHERRRIFVFAAPRGKTKTK